MTTLEERSRDIIRQASTKLAPIEYIRAEVRAMGPDEILDLAVAYLYAQVRNRKRSSVREIEQDAQRPVPRRDRTPTLVSAFTSDDESAQRFRSRIAAAMEDLRNGLYMEWTDDLLRSRFAVGDGTETTWGEATVDQHRARMAIHQRNAIAGMEGYARHAAAIEAIVETGSANLKEALARSELLPTRR